MGVGGYKGDSREGAKFKKTRREYQQSLHRHPVLELSVPLVAEAKVGKHWDEAH